MEDEQTLTKKDVKQNKQAGRKFGEGGMTFSKPSFSRKGEKIGNKGDFDAGLDDLDNDGVTKKDMKKNKFEGQREFVNLGSAARGGDREREEEPKERPVKPTFRGKLNLNKTGSQPDEQNQGVVKDYDFRNLKGQKREDDGEERKRDGENSRGGRGGGFRRNKDRGQDFEGRNQHSKQEEDDGGF